MDQSFIFCFFSGLSGIRGIIGIIGARACIPQY
jgi:hypothetical protein